MVNESRIELYEYVYDLLYNVVTKNVYKMNEPKELNDKDTSEGFLVIRIGDIYDESEFDQEAFAQVRVFVEAYVPPVSRGRLDKERYTYFENSISSVVKNEIQHGTNEHYSIQSDGVLSMEGNVDTNANNAYFIYVKSFIVTIQ